MDARTATSKAETTFHTGEVAPDENAHRGQLADSEWRVDDKELFQRSGEATAYQFYAALHMSAFGTKRTSTTEFRCPLLGVKRTSMDRY